MLNGLMLVFLMGLTMKIEYGDIVTMDLNPTRGAEIAKARPCIVVSRTSIIRHSKYAIVVPLTSNTERATSYHLVIRASHWNGLAKDSKALVEQIRSLDKIRYVKKVGSLEPLYLQELEKRILFVLNQRETF